MKMMLKEYLAAVKAGAGLGETLLSADGDTWGITFPGVFVGFRASLGERRSGIKTSDRDFVQQLPPLTSPNRLFLVVC